MEQNGSDPNSTGCGTSGITELPHPYLLLELILYPILLILCTFGNSIVIFAMRKQSRKSTGVYLSSMAVANILIMCLQLPKYVYMFVEYSHGYAKFLAWFTVLESWASSTLVNAEDWILIAFSLERLSAVLWPFLTLKWISYKSSLLIVSTIFILAGIFSLQFLIFYVWWLVHDNGVSAFSLIVPVWLQRWNVVQTQAEVIFTIIQFFIIFVVNITLMTFLSRRHESQKKLSTSISHSPSLQLRQSATKSSSLSRQLLMACFILYFVTQLPTLIMICLNMAASDLFCTYTYQGDGQVILAQLAKLFLMFNYSINFLFYCSFSPKFRAVFRFSKAAQLRV